MISLIFAIPYLRFVQTAKAQGVSSYISGVAGAITKLPLCQSQLVNAVKGLFSGSISTDGLAPTTPSEATFEDDAVDAVGSLTNKVASKIAKSENIPVSLPDDVTKSIKNTEKTSKATESKVSSLNSNDTCLKSIGRLIVKMLLQKLTLSTVEWINGGMNGSPKFIQDPGQYFADLGKEEILLFGQEINDPTKFPFAKQFMQNEANSFKQKFANNAQYSLDKMISDTSQGQYTGNDFQGDFSSGGWAAWDAMTQNAANNPLGFSLMAADELGKRIAKKVGLTESSLQQSGGYLGDVRCADPQGVTKEENDAALSGSSSTTYPNGEPRLCKKWELVTPGKMVADAATKTMNYQSDALLNAQDLNDAIAAIMDALLNSFTSNIQTNGFADSSSSYEFTNGLEGQFVGDPNAMINSGSSQTDKDFSEFQIAQSSFLSTHSDFNIRTDLNQALIDEQRIFIDKLAEQDVNIQSSDPSVASNSFTGNSGIIPIIYQLDYCIPGPHPGFEEDSRTAFNAGLSKVVPLDENSIQNMESDEIKGIVKSTLSLAAAAVGMAVGGTVGTVVPVIGNVVGAIVGAVVGYIVGWVVDLVWGTSDEEKIRDYYANYFEYFTGQRVRTCTAAGCDLEPEKTAALHNFGSFSGALNTLLTRYIEIIYDVFPPSELPSVTKEAAMKFNQIKGYVQMDKDNEDRIISMKNIIIRLTAIKKEIDTLNCQKDPSADNQSCTLAGLSGSLPAKISQDEYETGISQWTPAFSRISAEMVSGDDIAVVDNTTKQIIDEKDYIYKNLLKGPNGCEKDLEPGDPNGPRIENWYLLDEKRMTYPAPILYDYNKFKDGDILPDPFGSGYQNKMRGNWDIASSHPGFLNNVDFEDSKELCSDVLDDRGQSTNKTPAQQWLIHSPLCLHDMFPPRDWGHTVGGIFETFIGVW